MWTRKKVSNRAELLSDMPWKRNDTNVLTLSFQKTTKAKLLPMTPPTTIVPMMTVLMINE